MKLKLPSAALADVDGIFWRTTLGKPTPSISLAIRRAAPVAMILPVLVGALFLLSACGAGTSAAQAPLTSPSKVTSPAQSSAGGPASNNRLQKSEGGSVTIEVTWENQQTSGNALEFAVVMDTHSVDLDRYDLSKLATLRNDNGQEVTATAWQGPPGGGHHRSGKLFFPASSAAKPLIDPDTKYLELTIRDIANVKERVLRWNLEGKQ